MAQRTQRACPCCVLRRRHYEGFRRHSELSRVQRTSWSRREYLLFAREVEVTLGTFNFPDYVFEDQYNLIPIDSLNSYIEEHKHLPNIPPAKEVQEDGSINIAELQLKMLEKIEELSLYVIDLNNQIKALKAENKELRKTN